MTRKAVSHKILVGLEIHVQLSTRSKMFTSAPNASGALKAGGVPPEPNSAVDPVVLGLPGVLPVINKRAVELAMMVGMAMNCEIARYTKWDRKSYYYPDLPKNYQISQYDLPLCGNGTFNLVDEAGISIPIRIRRAHLEEDAGKLLHEAPGGYHINHSIVDLNRAGTPLLEIVTEPDFHTPRQVALFGHELQKLVQFLGVSEGQMQLGHMRFEPNINVHITDNQGNIHKTAITEIKNLNSFQVLEKATAYEISRQIREWEETGSLGKKSTYGWDEATQSTFHQRDKEEAHDYRYFPDPDLAPVTVDDAWLTSIKSQIGELPQARRTRYASVLGLSEKDAGLILTDKGTSDYFDAIVLGGVDAKKATSLIEAIREIANEKGQRLSEFQLAPSFVVGVAKLAAEGKIGANKETTKALINSALAGNATLPVEPEILATSLGLIQTTDVGAIDAAIDELIAQNPKSLQDYRGGKQAALGSLVGMTMKLGKGLNAKSVQGRLKERLQ